MQQPHHISPSLDISNHPPTYIHSQSNDKEEEYYGGARIYQASPFSANLIPIQLPLQTPVPQVPIMPSYVDSQKIKKKERNNSNSSDRIHKNKSISSQKPNSDSYQSNIKKPPVIREGDWECPECKNINFAKRIECNRCKASKPLPSKKDRRSATHLGGPPGLFKEGDWPCPKCRNVNFQKRNKCNRCGEGRPDDNEVRTGKAGGHYDRQDLKDKKNYKESDDEFDDFGRKKKKSRRRDNNSRSRSRSNGKGKDNSNRKGRSNRSKERSRKKSRERSRERHNNRQRSRSRS